MKPWPNDVLIHVAPRSGQEVRSPDEPTTDRLCRDCGRLLAVRLSSIAVSESHPLRCGRPVSFLCVPCAVTYQQPDVLTDLREAV